MCFGKKAQGRSVEMTSYQWDLAGAGFTGAEHKAEKQTDRQTGGQVDRQLLLCILWLW